MLFWSAISLGLVSSLHCLGMCGPLVMVFAGETGVPIRRALLALEYNLGRITTYILMGLCLGIIGQALWMGQLQQWTAILLGSILLLSGLLGIRLTFYLERWSVTSAITQRIRTRFQKLLARRQRHFFFGMLNGILPCGMVYLALAGALTMESSLQGAGFMFSFGLGTLPAMLAPFFLKGTFRHRLRGYLPHLQRAAILLTGAFLLARGLHVALPQEITLIEMLKHPVMCH